MDEVIKLLEELEDLIEGSKAMPFSSKVGVDKDEVYDIIADIRGALPNDIKQSKLIVQERNKILEDAKRDEITRQAYQQSAEIIEAAKKQAKEMRIGAMEYADEVLSQSENRLREMIESFRNECVSVDEYFNNSLNTLYENRQELRGINGR